jgi:hypothetical protein
MDLPPLWLLPRAIAKKLLSQLIQKIGSKSDIKPLGELVNTKSINNVFLKLRQGNYLVITTNY